MAFSLFWASSAAAHSQAASSRQRWQQDPGREAYEGGGGRQARVERKRCRSRDRDGNSYHVREGKPCKIVVFSVVRGTGVPALGGGAALGGLGGKKRAQPNCKYKAQQGCTSYSNRSGDWLILCLNCF